jgi:hypothetical protein
MSAPGERLRDRLEKVETVDGNGQLRGYIPGTEQPVIFTSEGQVFSDPTPELEELIADIGLRFSDATIDGAELLEDIKSFIGRFMVLPSEEAADLLALWTLHTHARRGGGRHAVPAGGLSSAEQR